MNTLLKASLGILLANSVQAAVYTYEGVDQGEWTEAENWSADGQTATTAPGVADQIIINDKSVIWTTAKNNYKNYSNINITGSGKLTITTSDAKIQNSTFHVDNAEGLTLAGQIWIGNNNSNGGITFDLMNQGSVVFNKMTDGATGGFANWGVTVTGNLNINNTGHNLVIEQRVLIDVLEFSGTDLSALDTGCGITANFTSNNEGISLNNLGYNQTIDLSSASVGDYTIKFVYNDNNDKAKGGQFIAQYVTGDAIPEPATTSLSLIGLGALALRRRRKS